MLMRRLLSGTWVLVAVLLPWGWSAAASAESGAHRLPPPPPEVTPIEWPAGD